MDIPERETCAAGRALQLAEDPDWRQPCPEDASGRVFLADLQQSLWLCAWHEALFHEVSEPVLCEAGRRLRGAGVPGLDTPCTRYAAGVFRFSEEPGELPLPLCAEHLAVAGGPGFTLQPAGRSCVVGRTIVHLSDPDWQLPCPALAAVRRPVGDAGDDLFLCSTHDGLLGGMLARMGQPIE